jgi:hypothetical protein
LIDWVQHIVKILQILTFLIESILHQTLDGDLCRYQSLQQVLQYANNATEIFDLLSRTDDQLIIIAARPILEILFAKFPVSPHFTDQPIGMIADQLTISLSRLLDLVRQYRFLDSTHIVGTLSKVKKAGKGGPMAAEIQKITALVESKLALPAIRLFDADCLSQEIRPIAESLLNTKPGKNWKDLYFYLEGLRFSLLSQQFPESPPEHTLQQKLALIKSYLEFVIQGLRITAHESGSLLARALSGEWNEFISRVIDDLNVLDNATAVLGPESSRYQTICDFLREIAIVLVRLDHKVFNDTEFLSRLGQVFQDALDYVADLANVTEKSVQDLSREVFQVVCDPLGPLLELTAISKEFSFEIPPKRGSRGKLFRRLRRLLKAVARNDFRSLSQTHILNVTICEGLIHFLEHSSQFEKLKSILVDLTLTKDDSPEFEFQHRAMQMEFRISRYLTQLMLLDSQTLLGEKPDFTLLEPLAESVSEDLIFDVHDLTSQSGVCRTLLNILETITFDFTLSAEDKEELLQLCSAPINKPPQVVNAVGLVSSIHFLRTYFDVFSGKSEDFTKFSKALWRWCDFLAGVPNHSHGLAFLQTKLKARFKTLISEPQDSQIHFPRISNVLKEASESIQLLAAVDQCPRIPQKYSIPANDLEKVAEQLGSTFFARSETSRLNGFPMFNSSASIICFGPRIGNICNLLS